MNITSQILKNNYEATVENRSRLHSFIVMPDGQIGDPVSIFDLPNIGNKDNDSEFVVVPGSFNPLHIAHRAIFDGVTKLYAPSKKVISVFEISINRKDKEPLSFEDLLQRIKQFEWYAPVWITNALFFMEKAGLVSKWVRPCFQIGYDTAERFIQDHGTIGIGGMAANFIVYPRIINGVLCNTDTLSHKYGILPHNMQAGPQRSEKEMITSSTFIRNGNK